MSNIGKNPLFFPKDVKIFKFLNFIILKNKKSIYKFKSYNSINILYIDSVLFFNYLGKNKKIKQLWGTLRKTAEIVLFSIFKEHLIKLKFIGVGFKAFFIKKTMVFRLGLSHKLFFVMPKDIKIKKIKKRPPTFLLKSWNIEYLKKVSHCIRQFKKPEPYKGKGIAFLNENIIRKEGKKSKK